jgi:branched-subunit amino acid aminotransferase/4-amino-4-deoxychorismate lyase
MSVEPLAFLNGRFVTRAELALSFRDAGFVFGATITDFCRTYRHRLFRWPDHLARLRHDCAACQIPLPYPDAELTAAAERLVQHNAAQLADTDDLALITFATPGPLGYLIGAAENGPPTLGMHTLPLPAERYARFFTEGVTLAVAGVHATDPCDILPAGVKHRSRLHWWLAGRATHDSGTVPVLLDAHGTADTPIGGILAVVGETVIRPEPGTVLESISVQVVRELCGRVGLDFTSAPLDFRTLGQRADVSELMLAGSGFGLAGVRRFGEREFNWPGPVFRKLQEAWAELVRG